MSNAPKIRPLGQNVLLRRLEAEEKTKGGIVLPDTAKEKPKEGEGPTNLSTNQSHL